MKMPRLFTGWVTTNGLAHETKEAAIDTEIRSELKALLNVARERNIRDSMGVVTSLSNREIIEIVTTHFNITPKVVTE